MSLITFRLKQRGQCRLLLEFVFLQMVCLFECHNQLVKESFHIVTVRVWFTVLNNLDCPLLRGLSFAFAIVDFYFRPISSFCSGFNTFVFFTPVISLIFYNSLYICTIHLSHIQIFMPVTLHMLTFLTFKTTVAKQKDLVLPGNQYLLWLLQLKP